MTEEMKLRLALTKILGYANGCGMAYDRKCGDRGYLALCRIAVMAKEALGLKEM